MGRRVFSVGDQPRAHSLRIGEGSGAEALVLDASFKILRHMIVLPFQVEALTSAVGDFNGAYDARGRRGCAAAPKGSLA